MKTEELQDKELKQLFHRLNPEILPKEFNRKLMQRIVREAYRKEKYSTVKSWSILSFAILSILITGKLILDYFSVSLSFDFLNEQAELFIPLTGISFVLILLFTFDYWLRKRYSPSR